MKNPAAYLITPEQKRTVSGLTDVDAGRLYVMDYTADYRLDDMLCAGVTSVAELTRYVRTHLLSGGDTPSAAPDAGCSTFFCKSPDGACLVGRNFDYRMDMTAVLVRTRPEGAYASLSLADTGWVGYGLGSLSDGVTDISMAVSFPYLLMDGMNEKGLFVSVLKLDGTPARQHTGKPAAMTTVLMRLALDRAASVGEAVALFAAYDMHAAAEDCDFHFLLADAAGRSAVIEYVNDQMRVLDAAIATNYYLDPSVTEEGAGRYRYDVIKYTFDYRDAILTRTDAMALLRLVRQDGPEGESSYTQWSAVYDLTARALDVAVRHDYTRVFHASLYGNLEIMWT